MNNNRPKIKVPLATIDIIVELATAVIILLLFVFTIIEYSQISETIPLHFDALGTPDRYGDKSNLFMLPILGLLLSILMYVLSKYPYLHNYTVNFTEENALKNYRFSSRILRFTSLGIAILFGFIQFIIIQMGKGKDVELGAWMVPVIVGISILLPIGILIYQRKMNKN